jgi:hypothetical protein
LEILAFHLQFGQEKSYVEKNMVFTLPYSFVFSFHRKGRRKHW